MMIKAEQQEVDLQEIKNDVSSIISTLIIKLFVAVMMLNYSF